MIDSKVIKRENKTVYGQIKRVFPSSIAIHLTTGEKLIVSLNEAQMKEVSNRLGQTVGLIGTAASNAANYAIVRFDVEAISPYRQGFVSKGFAELRELSSGFWDKLTDEQIKEHLKGD